MIIVVLLVPSFVGHIVPSSYYLGVLICTFHYYSSCSSCLFHPILTPFCLAGPDSAWRGRRGTARVVHRRGGQRGGAEKRRGKADRNNTMSYHSLVLGESLLPELWADARPPSCRVRAAATSTHNDTSSPPPQLQSTWTTSSLGKTFEIILTLK